MSQFNRTFRLDRLYHRYLKHSGIQWTVMECAEFLESLGFIKIKDKRYEQIKNLSRKDFLDLLRREK